VRIRWETIAACAACALLLAPASATAGQSARVMACGGGELAIMLCLVNDVRVARGLPRVGVSPALARSSRLRAGAIVRCRHFSHTPCGQSFGSVFRTVGYTRQRFAVGENLSWGSGYLGSPQHALAGWLTSPPHRSVLLSPRWREVGIAVVATSGLFAPGPNRVWVTQFGRRG
jgi:uncharacterized protein YkwD